MTLARDPKQGLLWSPDCGLLAVDSWLWRHLGDIWETPGEASGRALGGTWEVQATWEASGSRLRSKACVLSAKVSRQSVSRRCHELDLHVDGKFTAT